MRVLLTRHGESVDNSRNRIGGDSGLTADGLRFARALARRVGAVDLVLESELRRSHETASHVRAARRVRLRALNEIDSGLCDGMTVVEAEHACPERAGDKLRFRYPSGESYLDLRDRVVPAFRRATENATGTVVVVAHKAVVRVLLAHLDGRAIDPHEPVPLGRVFVRGHGGSLPPHAPKSAHQSRVSGPPSSPRPARGTPATCPA